MRALALLAALAASACTYDLSSVPRPEGGANGTAGMPGDCSDAAVAGDKRNGEACGCDGQCASGACVDGVCCSSACQETCSACNVPGFQGTCTFVPVGLPPSRPGGCPAEPATSCGRDGTCDGAGACALHPQGTSCKQPVCGVNAITSAYACDGAGKCSPSAPVLCTPYQCDASGATPKCYGSCIGSAQCADGRPCVGGSCGKKFVGAACAAAAECGTGFCVDGVCCDGACAGSCTSCNQVGSMGICTLTAFGKADPKGKCADQGALSCGQTGACDGQGACAKYPLGTECGPPVCEGTRLRFASTCNGQGLCRSGAVIDCAPFGCAGGACRDTCRSDADCSPGVHCMMGSCGLKELGATCQSGTQCRSGFCADGVCCKEACSGACRSCAMPVAPGTCTRIGAGLPDPRGLCVEEKAASCGKDGTCDGTGGCRLYPSGTECAPESCTMASHRAVSTCDGRGTCLLGSATVCAPFQCNGADCFTACRDDGDCVAPAKCTGGSCGKKANGSACLAAEDCTSGICAAGTCCDRACGGACESCSMPASPGLCTALAPGAVCGEGRVCSAEGACAPCATGSSCPTSACHTAQISCASGAPVCTVAGMMSPGTSCGAGKVCSSVGTCVDCAAGAPCTGPLCRTAQIGCSSGGPVCTVTGTAPPGTACGSLLACDPTGNCTGCGAAGQPCCQGTCSAGSTCQAGMCACTPACAGKSCGPDGCGGICPPGCTGSAMCSASGSCVSCGAAGQPCCAGGACDPGVTCTGGTCTCVPSCAGKSCGSDGCGGTCPPGCAAGTACVGGACASCGAIGQPCCANNACAAGATCSGGTCTCAPTCGGAVCGPDGCGGTCAPGCGAGTVCSGGACVSCGAAGQACCPGNTCTAPATCGPTGVCVCTPNCAGKTCGDDGCGGTCPPGCGSTGTCNGSTCVACGGRGQPCCPGKVCASSRDTCQKSICECNPAKDCCGGCPGNQICCFPGCSPHCN